MQQPDPLTSEELEAIDAIYRPIPPFMAWPQQAPRAKLFDRYRAELTALRSQAGATDAFSMAVTTVLRAAAFDTDAIEGLYTTDRGLTFTVATQAAEWEHEVGERGSDALELFAAQLEAYELVMDVATHHRPITEVWIGSCTRY
jgi:Fic family protein